MGGKKIFGIKRITGGIAGKIEPIGITTPDDLNESDGIEGDSGNDNTVVESSSDSGENGIVEPAAIPESGAGSDSGTGKRRGRKPGTKNGTRKTAPPEDLTTLFFSLHMMLAAVTSSPELVLSEDESAKLASAVARVNDFYGGTTIPEKYMVWTNLVMACGSIYGPRVISIMARKESEPKVVTINGGK